MSDVATKQFTENFYENDYYFPNDNKINSIPKAPDRLKVLERICEYEKNSWFTKDVEDDPEAPILLPDEVDYLGKKISSKVKTKIANFVARRFINKLIRDNELIISEIKGLENFTSVKGGALMTCNHFNAFDNFAIYKTVENYINHKEMYKVIREGNYTNFPGFYGFLFKNCNTLPLSSNSETMHNFMKAVSELLKRGEKILIYAEQGMWWNYRKPRPLTDGAFWFASSNNVPVIPFFITMKDTDIVESNGFYRQAYTINILPAIYPNQCLTKKQNIEYMKKENYEAWKKVYEETYGIPLVYGEKK